MTMATLPKALNSNLNRLDSNGVRTAAKRLCPGMRLLGVQVEVPTLRVYLLRIARVFSSDVVLPLAHGTQ